MQGAYAADAQPASAPVTSSVFTPAHDAAVAPAPPPPLPAAQRGGAPDHENERVYNYCGGAVYAPEFLYEYAAGQEYDSESQRNFGYGSDIYQRLMLGPRLHDNCFRLLLQHVSSVTPLPDSRLTVNSVAATYTYQDGSHTLGGNLGLGATEYSGISNLTTLDIVGDLRYRVVWRLSVEGSASIPIGNLIGNPLNNGYGLFGLSLRLDWRHVGVRVGLREVQLDTRYRESAYSAVMLKF